MFRSGSFQVGIEAVRPEQSGMFRLVYAPSFDTGTIEVTMNEYAQQRRAGRVISTAGF